MSARRSTLLASLAALSVLVVLGLGGGWWLSESVPVTASGGTHVVDTVRGLPPEWYQITRRSDWFLVQGHDIAVQNQPHGAGTWPLAKIKIVRGLSWADFSDGSPWPPGTVTSTLTVGGRQATRYRNAGVDGYGYASQSVIDVPSTGVSVSGADDYVLMLYVMRAADQATHDALEAELDAVVNSMMFITDAQSQAAWTSTFVKPAAIPGIVQYEVMHPSGWSVRESAGSITVAGGVAPPFTAGATSIVITPGQPRGFYDSAQPIPGSDLAVRFVSASVQGGRATTTYAVSTNPDGVEKWVVTVPDVPAGSPDYWLYDQTVWRMMYESYVWYGGTGGYP